MAIDSKALRSRNGGYGVHIDKVTDFRRKETVVCFSCSGPVYYVTRRFCSGWHCEKCGEIRAINIVRGNAKCQPPV